jgi:WXG100 family type VII secretion target
MPPDFSVDYDQMRSVAQALTSGHGEISSQLGQLKAKVDQLVQTGFQTRVASGKFDEGYDEFNKGVIQTLEGMLEMSQFLTDFVQNTQDIDRI